MDQKQKQMEECDSTQFEACFDEQIDPPASQQSKRHKWEQIDRVTCPLSTEPQSYSLKPVLPFRNPSHDGFSDKTPRTPKAAAAATSKSPKTASRRPRARASSLTSPMVNKWRLADWQDEPEVRPYWDQAEQRMGYRICKQPRAPRKGAAPRELPRETLQLMDDLASLGRDVPGVLRRIVRNATAPGEGGEPLSAGDEAQLGRRAEACIAVHESCRCREETLRCMGLLVPFLGRAGRICPGSVVVPEGSVRPRNGED